jgi:hypothetical protein
MRRRYEAQGHDGKLIVVFDEFQEHADDAVIAGLLKKLAAQGRAAGVHTLAATQHPSVSAFGATETRRQFTGKLALRVEDSDASRVAVGGKLPRADYLLGGGDCYTVAPGSCHRVQGAFVDGSDYDEEEGGDPIFLEWPDYDAEDVGQALPEKRPPGRPRRPLQAEEVGVALLSAMEEEGRTYFKRRMEGADLGRPGTDRARSIMGFGRALLEWLEQNGIGLVYLDD